jgi:hypothetical protein
MRLYGSIKCVKLEQFTPNYIHVTVNGNDHRSTNTEKAAFRYCLNQELKFLYKKKLVLCAQLYTSHLECVAYWQDCWLRIQMSANQNVDKINEATYNKLNKNFWLPTSDKTKIRGNINSI